MRAILIDWLVDVHLKFKVGQGSAGACSSCSSCSAAHHLEEYELLPLQTAINVTHSAQADLHTLVHTLCDSANPSSAAAAARDPVPDHQPH